MGRSGSLFCVSVEPIGENEKGRGPKANKYAKAFAMGLSLGVQAACLIPDGNRTNNRGKAQNKTEVVECFKLRWFHESRKWLIDIITFLLLERTCSITDPF